MLFSCQSVIFPHLFEQSIGILPTPFVRYNDMRKAGSKPMSPLYSAIFATNSAASRPTLSSPTQSSIHTVTNPTSTHDPQTILLQPPIDISPRPIAIKTISNISIAIHSLKQIIKHMMRRSLQPLKRPHRCHQQRTRTHHTESSTLSSAPRCCNSEKSFTN